MHDRSGARGTASAWLAGELASLSRHAAQLPVADLGSLPAAAKVTQVLITSGGGLARELSSLGSTLESGSLPAVVALPPLGLRGIGFALSGTTAEGYRRIAYSVDLEYLGAVADEWHVLANDLVVAGRDWNRSCAQVSPGDVSARMAGADLQVLAHRAQQCAELLDSIATGVRRLRAELSILESSWVTIESQLQSLLLMAQSVVEREMFQRRVRDAAGRTYNASVDAWELRSGSAVSA